MLPQDAVRGEYREVAKLLADNGAKVFEEGKLLDLGTSRLAGVFGYVPQKMWDFDPDWEIDPASLEVMEKLGEGEFGVVHKARWCAAGGGGVVGAGGGRRAGGQAGGRRAAAEG